MSLEVLNARSRRESGKPKEGCGECGSEGTLWKAEDGFWYCQKCIDLHGIRIVENETPKKVFSAFVCSTTPATVYEYRCRRPSNHFVALYDAVYFAYIVMSVEGAGPSRFGDKVFEAGTTYEYHVEITGARDGLELRWLTENVLMRLTPTDRNWAKRSHAEHLTRDGFMKKGKHFTFHKKYQDVPVRWTPPGLRSKLWEPGSWEEEEI